MPSSTRNALVKSPPPLVPPGPEGQPGREGGGHVGAADHDDDGHEGGHRSVREGRHAQEGEVHGGRRPPTGKYAKEIGADGYAPDAAPAAEKFKAFVS